MTPVSFRDRKNKLQTRVIYNDGVQKCAGLHNQDGRIAIDKISGQEETFDMLNLNCNMRTQVMQEQFELIEEIMKK